MPFTPAIKEHHLGDPIDLTSDSEYPSLSLVGKSFAGTIEHIRYRNLVNNMPFDIDHLKRPGEAPEPAVTQEDIEGWKEERPDLPNIPVGVPRYVGQAQVDMYDNDRNLQRYKGQVNPGTITKIGMWGGSFGASMLNPMTWVAGLGTGALVEKGLAGVAESTIGKQVMDRMAISDIIGAGAARTATQIAQSSVRWGAFSLGAQLEEEREETDVAKILDQPYSYLQSLQNVGWAGLEGMLFGAAAGGAGRLLLGERVRVGEPTTQPGARGMMMETPESRIEVPAQYERRGGLLNRPEFNNIPQATKDLIGRVYRPWSRDSNTTMTEEATGQMANGQTVMVDPILKQGMVEEGENFRAAMRDGGVDVEALDAALSDAHDNVRAEMADAFAAHTEMVKAERTLLEGEAVAVRENKSMSQEGILKRFRQAQYNENLVENVPETVPENLRKHIEMQKKIDKLEAKVKDAPETASNTQVKRRIAQLKKNQPKILTPKRELSAIKKELLNSVGREDFGTGESYQRLSELAKVWQAAKRLKDYLDLKNDSHNRISELAAHDFLSQSLRDHVNNTHEPVSESEINDYADRLTTPGIPNTPLPRGVAESQAAHEGYGIDDFLNEYSPDEVKSLAERTGDAEMVKQIDRNQKRLNNLERYREMAAKMVDCILKGTL